MFPSDKQIGVVVSTEEAVMIHDAHFTANTYMNYENIPGPLRGGNFVLPEPESDGNVSLDETLAYKAQAIAKLATRAAQYNWERNKKDYITRLDAGDETLLGLVQDEIVENQNKMIAFEGLAAQLAENLERSQMATRIEA